MWFISQIAEARIAEAIARGEFENLPGAGKPLRLEDDRAIPEELRVAYRVLKNAGCLPRELELRREIADVRALVAATHDEATRVRAWKRMNHLLAQLEGVRGRPSNLRCEQVYHEKLMERCHVPVSSSTSSADRTMVISEACSPPARREV